MTTLSCILGVVYSIYLLFGGLIFSYLEYEVKEQIIFTDNHNWSRLKDLTATIEPSDNDELTELLGWLQNQCDRLPSPISLPLTSVGNRSQVLHKIEVDCPLLKNSTVHIIYEYPWSFLDSLYFSMTVITTIGYGNKYPTTNEGKVACILYSLIGIPVTLLLLKRTSSFFGKLLYDLFTSRVDAVKQSSKIFIGIGAFFYILFGFVIFIFLPAVIFMHTERWTYLDSVYFAYITLTTIGFGDLVTGNDMNDPWLTVYQIGVILWIIAGLGYWVMVANFMVLALKSKKVYAMAKKLTELKKIVAQVQGTKQNSGFLNQSSKPSLNFLMQFASVLAVPGSLADLTDSTEEPKSTKQAQHRPPLPGIAALFNMSGSGGAPMFQKVLGSGLARQPAQKTDGTPNMSGTTSPDGEHSKKEFSVTVDSELPSSSMYPISNLSSPSEFSSENNLSCHSLLSEENDLRSEQNKHDAITSEN